MACGTADGDHEVGPGEDHGLAGVDDRTGRGELLVLDVGDRLEDPGDLGELRPARFVQTEPDEAVALLCSWFVSDPPTRTTGEGRC